MKAPRKRPKKEVDPDAQLVSVTLPQRDWRAAMAVYYSALSITDEPVHRALISRIYKAIEAQTGQHLAPVLLEEDHAED